MQKTSQPLEIALDSTVVLQMESPAPSIQVENWLRGEPLTSFEPGKVYVIEFWAKWCSPCVDAMPHLVQLQEKYKDSGLEIVGVAAGPYPQPLRPTPGWTRGCPKSARI
ncbi:TlpA disulfide reductase family protein [Mesorhizobium kowhaii]|uniref:TlpA disulfide reductase family protein n=1 Tax=Mesorhizobium kowhaii TaxID=1300272 RepID=UPI00315D6A4D